MFERLPIAILEGITTALVIAALNYWWDATVPSVGGIVVSIIVFTAVFLVINLILKSGRVGRDVSLRDIVARIRAITRSN